MCAASVYPVSPEAAKHSLTDEAAYRAMYQQSVINPEGFWREQAARLDWIRPFSEVKRTSFDDHHVDIKWFADGTLNVSANCLDRHLAERGDQVAIIWEGDDPSEHREITYRELYQEVCKFANALRGQDVHRGDVVTIYMPMIPEAAVAMLACARIGAIHSVVFGGFSPEALAGRIIDGSSKVVITADQGIRGGKTIALKENVDEALTNPQTRCVQKIIVVRRTGANIRWHPHRDVSYDVLNVSGHRMGTAEIESALVAHAKVAEAAAVGVPHPLKGQAIYVYVTLVAGTEPSDTLRQELQQWVRHEIGPIAVPDTIQWAPGLPKTRSGKIMRRLLRKIATDDYDTLGDTSTLADPGVVDQLIAAHEAVKQR